MLQTRGSRPGSNALQKTPTSCAQANQYQAGRTNEFTVSAVVSVSGVCLYLSSFRCLKEDLLGNWACRKHGYAYRNA